MEKTKKGSIRKYLIALVVLAIGIWMISYAGGAVYGFFIGVIFLLMAVTSIVNTEYVVKFGST